MEISVTEYLGKLGDGILVLINVYYEEFYDATVYYDNENIVLTIPDALEEKIGKITEYVGYEKTLSNIRSKVVPYSEMFDNLDDVDFTKWVEAISDINQL